MSVAAALVPVTTSEPRLRSVPDERAEVMAVLRDAELQLDRIAVWVAQGDLARHHENTERAEALYRAAAEALDAFRS